jgi:conjugative relaxase-like TrwC/TraI family protein
VLSLSKLAGADQRYYLDLAHGRVDHTASVSSGAEDYYLSGPEGAGRWVGSAARALDLEGDVAEADLRAVLSRHDPRSARLLEGSVRRARMPGFDLMFSVPKSASVLFGIGPPRVQRAVLDAQAAAVQSAMRYLEQHACRTRRGAGGYEIVLGDGFVGAAFRHRTSRAGDPQVHTHVLIANATRIQDGTWASLDGRAIYAEARTAGFVHEAVFRAELSKRLGISWTEAHNGIAEIDGVPRPVIDAFSRRRAEIDAQVNAWGRDTAKARQSAAVQTRKRKDYAVTPERLAPEWRERAASLGLDAARVAEIVGRRCHRRRLDDSLIAKLASSEGLTAQQSSFDRRDVVRAVAEAARDGASLAEIESYVDRFLADGEVVTLAEPGGLLRTQDVIRRRDGRLVPAIVATPRYSTAELLAVEQGVVDEALRSTTAGAGVAGASAVERGVARRPTIGDDQRTMIRRLCVEGAGVQVVIGPAGTGKTFALAAAREAWEESGFTVLGAAVARRAAVELSSAAGIDATSVAALLLELRHGRGDLLDARTVLVVDEAGTLGTRAVAELIDRARRAGAKLVLVGDPEQLPEIDAGGAFRALVARTNPIVLETNRRQERAADRRLLELWRSGEIRSALTIATDAGDLVLAASPEEAVSGLVADYTAAVERGEDAIMLAPRRAEVRHLNELARQSLLLEGRITGPGLSAAGRDFAVGDRIVLRLNAPDLRVENGTRGTVTAVDTDAEALTIALADGSTRQLPSRYVHLPTRRGGASIEHGYALTTHLAQGMTTDRTFVLGSETVYREWGYTAWSRSRLGTRFYAVEPELSDEHHTAAPVDVDRFEELVRRLDRSEAQRMALDSLPDDAADRRAAASKHATVVYLDQALGSRPETFRKRQRWDRAARQIERYRARHAITDPYEALGPQPQDRLERLAWRRAERTLGRHQLYLGALPQRAAREIER